MCCWWLKGILFNCIFCLVIYNCLIINSTKSRTKRLEISLWQVGGKRSTKNKSESRNGFPFTLRIYGQYSNTWDDGEVGVCMPLMFRLSSFCCKMLVTCGFLYCHFLNANLIAKIHFQTLKRFFTIWISEFEWAFSALIFWVSMVSFLQENSLVSILHGVLSFLWITLFCYTLGHRCLFSGVQPFLFFFSTYAKLLMQARLNLQI